MLLIQLFEIVTENNRVPTFPCAVHAALLGYSRLSLPMYTWQRPTYGAVLLHSKYTTSTQKLLHLRFIEFVPPCRTP